MGSKIALRVAMLVIGTAFATAPALAQQQAPAYQGDQYLQSDGGPPAAEYGPASQPGFIDVWSSGRTYNYDPGYGNYDPGYGPDSNYNSAPGPGTATGPTDYYNYFPGTDATPTGEDTAWCQAHYRSYDPSTGMYRGFDGGMHPCP